MKKIFATIMLLTITAKAQAASFSVGAVNDQACFAFGVSLVGLAEEQAKKAADENCKLFGPSESIKVSTEVLAQYRGSCWAGAMSGAAVKYTYTCKN